jgi:hypothetical protein
VCVTGSVLHVTTSWRRKEMGLPALINTAALARWYAPVEPLQRFQPFPLSASRHAEFAGLRDDKLPTEVAKEQPA